MVLVCFASAAAAASPPASRPRPPNRPTPPPADARDAQRVQLDRLTEQYDALYNKQAYFAAAKVARQALAVALAGPDVNRVDSYRSRLANMLSRISDHQGAIEQRRLLLAAAERDYGAESPEVLNELSPLESEYGYIHADDEMEASIQRRIAITKALHGDHSIEYAGVLDDYSGFFASHHQTASAQPLEDQSLSLREQLGKADDPTTMLRLARMYERNHQPDRAAALRARVVAYADRTDVSFLTRQSGVYALADEYQRKGREDLAAPLRHKLEELYEADAAQLEREKPDDDGITSDLISLAYQYHLDHDLAGEARALDRATRRKLSYGNGYTVASMRAQVKYAQGKPREAFAELVRAKDELRKRSPGAENLFDPFLIYSLIDLHDFAQTERLIVEYLATSKKQWRTNPALYGLAEVNAAYWYMMIGKLAPALPLLADGLDTAEREFQHTLETGTEGDSAAYFTTNAYVLDTVTNYALGYAPHDAKMARLGLTTLLRRKGRVLDAAASNLTALRGRLSSEDKQLLDELSSARSQLAQLTVAGPNATGPDSYAKEVAAYETKIQQLETQISKRMAAYRPASQSITLAAVQKAIPKDARLIEIVNVPGLNKSAMAAYTPPEQPRHYAAYVVGATGDPVLIDLGSATAIDEAIEQFRAALADPDNDRASELGHALYALTLAKLMPALGGATNLLIAPDGALNVVPFAALVDDHGDALVKRYTFSYLTSGRDLLRPHATAGLQRSAIFADPAFDAAPSTTTIAKARGQRSADLTQLIWKRLPGTGQEADEILKHLHDAAIYRGAAATETALKAVHRPKILHLATHGFFLPDEPSAATSSGGSPPATDSHENPLLRAGLVLAGANQLKSGDDDGILTALEATGLDLRGTQLVVLSACETGVGKVTNGDGVYGLRRALVIAGAESLMMSLWQVDDAATRDLMAGYYTRLTAGAPRSTALREIQLELLRNPRYAHPYFWASFVPTGANTPIR